MTTMCRICGRELGAVPSRGRSDGAIGAIGTAARRPSGLMRIPAHKTRTGTRCFGSGAIATRAA